MNAKKLNTIWKKTYKYANVLLNIIETREKKIRNIKCKNTQLVTWIDKYLLGFVRLRACSLAFRCVTNTSFLRFCPFSYSFFCPVHRESANETVSNEKMGFFAVTYLNWIFSFVLPFLQIFQLFRFRFDVNETKYAIIFIRAKCSSTKFTIHERNYEKHEIHTAIEPPKWKWAKRVDYLHFVYLNWFCVFLFDICLQLAAC